MTVIVLFRLLARSQIRSQWENPSDILSLLLLVGGDVIQKALGQLAHQPYLPVAFSFGWVAYAFSGVSAAVGEHKLMPESDCQAVVINVKNGFVRNNRSWVLGRLVRDIDHWMDKEPKAALAATIRDAQWEEDDKVARKNARRDKKGPLLRPQTVLKKGLCVAIYKAKAASAGSSNSLDPAWILAILVLFLQLGIAIVPCILYGNWEIVCITAAGSALSFLAGILPQWRHESLACRRLSASNKDKTIALTKGNGAQHAILVIGAEDSYNLEDLATCDAVPQLLTTIWSLSSLCLWIFY